MCCTLSALSALSLAAHHFKHTSSKLKPEHKRLCILRNPQMDTEESMELHCRHPSLHDGHYTHDVGQCTNGALKRNSVPCIMTKRNPFSSCCPFQMAILSQPQLQCHPELCSF